jgi:hypothetical protein
MESVKIANKKKETMKQQLEAIREIDKEAAEYIETEILPNRDGNFVKALIDRGGHLLDLFRWNKSPQGHEYWIKIFKKVV